MKKLTRDDLMPLERYAVARQDFRTKVMFHKQARAVHLGAHITLTFEDRLTIQYQVQEMLRIERIFEPAGIEEELAAYNPLIPDGQNLKATLLIEYPDPDERKIQLTRLKGVEDRIWVQVIDHARCWAIADEDLERENEDKTSSVHFLRFEIGADAARALKAGARLAIGVEHPAYTAALEPVAEATRAALAADLD